MIYRWFIIVTVITSSTCLAQSETRSISETVTALYESISFETEAYPDTVTFKNICMPSCTFYDATKNEAQVSTTAEFLQQLLHGIDNGRIISFQEHEKYAQIDSFANIAQVLSTYQLVAQLSNNQTFETNGINLYQLVKHNGKWRISSICWDDETTDQIIPVEYQQREEKSEPVIDETAE